MKRYRIITARANAGYHGYVVQKKGWVFWRDVLDSNVYYTLEDARAAIYEHAIKFRKVVEYLEAA